MFRCPRCGSTEQPIMVDDFTVPLAEQPVNLTTVLWECAHCDYQRLVGYRTAPFTDLDGS